MGESRRPHPTRTAQKVIEYAERDREIVRLKRRGLTYDEIAATGICTKDAARIVVNKRAREARDEMFTETALYVAESLDRLSALLDAIWDRAMDGDEKAVAEARRIVSDMGDYTGAKAPIRHEWGESDVDRALRELESELDRRAREAAGQAPPLAIEAGGSETPDLG
jgi:hypothetical protein